MPARTSPVPPVAIPGFPVGFTAARPSGRATMVRWPLSDHGALALEAKARAVSEPRGLHLRHVVAATRRAISPGCGVTTVGAGRRAAPRSGAPVARPRALSAVGVDEERQRALGHEAPRRRRDVPAIRPSPGPRTTASRLRARARARSTPPRFQRPPAVDGQRLGHHLGARPPRRSAAPAPGVATVTRPAPARSAAVAARTAAPVFPTEPATTSTWP